MNIPDIRIGQGMDFHRLELNPDRPLVLGGFTLPDEELALIGHSDADVVIHALSDAVLGALALGDIGQHFPDSDPSLKNMDSAIILQKCLDLMQKKGYRISNVDITLMGEKPKVAPVREEITTSLARLLGVGVERVGWKATTTERMGALGRGEGLGCLAVVLLVSL